MQPKKEIKPHWYLLYTNPRAEKRVYEELRMRGYETFLPIQKVLKQWSDRKKWIDEPLFKGYIFIRTDLERNFFQILNLPGVVKFISFEGRPVKVDSREIEFVKLLVGNFSEIESIDMVSASIEIGDEVEVIIGPLAGTQGRLVHKRGNNKFLIELHSIQQNVLITIPQSQLGILKNNSVSIQ